MPEGIDDAARAFATAINPESPARPRDSGGRFAATKPTPEPMFEPRQVEGDPLTGDTSDGGEDSRLVERDKAANDNRAADRSKDTANDNEPPEHVGEGDEGEGEEKGEGEGEKEKEKPEDLEPEDDGWALMLNGKPVEKLEVTVDGQPQEVSLKECVRGYIREATFHQRMNKVAEARQVVEQEAQTVVQGRDYYTQKLNHLDRLFSELTPPQPNWDQEFAADPAKARAQQKAYQAIYEKIQFVNDELQRTQTEAAQEYEHRSRRYAQEQFSSFVAEANIHDEKALNTEMSAMRTYAKMRGFGEGEIATVYDKRMLLVLRDAAKYQASTTAQPKAVIPGKGKTLTPGSATPIGNAPRRSLDEAQQRLAKTGRLDDASLVFQRLLR